VINMARFITPIVESGDILRDGKGFSAEELETVELTMGKAKSLGIPVDTKRKSGYEENVEALKEFLEETKDLDYAVPKPVFTSKPIRGRAYRGKTSAGQKMRNLSRRK
jgi:hypothetical protein